MEVGLIEQLVNDLQELFKNNESYPNLIVKEIYEVFENEDNYRYFDETERVADLGYQFTINAEQTLDKTAIQNVRAIAQIIDNYLKGPKYRCLRRLGSLNMKPLPSDENVMLGYLRYDCSLEIGTNTIYRRY